jgi:maltodextrin utilization protein YvdJ
MCTFWVILFTIVFLFSLAISPVSLGNIKKKLKGKLSSPTYKKIKKLKQKIGRHNIA